MCVCVCMNIQLCMHTQTYTYTWDIWCACVYQFRNLQLRSEQVMNNKKRHEKYDTLLFQKMDTLALYTLALHIFSVCNKSN